METTNILSKSGLNTAVHGVNHRMEECPVCLEEHLLVQMCPNKHKLCRPCLSKIEQVYNEKLRSAVCPLCRAPIPHKPKNEAEKREPHPDEIFGHNTNAGFQDMDVFGLNTLPRTYIQRRVERRTLNENALNTFYQNIRTERIPHNADYGGTHTRKCGHRGCNRTGGSEGVRFLLYGETGKRRYRCEQHAQ